METIGCNLLSRVNPLLYKEQAAICIRSQSDYQGSSELFITSLSPHTGTSCSPRWSRLFPGVICAEWSSHIIPNRKSQAADR